MDFERNVEATERHRLWLGRRRALFAVTAAAAHQPSEKPTEQKKKARSVQPVASSLGAACGPSGRPSCCSWKCHGDGQRVAGAKVGGPPTCVRGGGAETAAAAAVTVITRCVGGHRNSCGSRAGHLRAAPAVPPSATASGLTAPMADAAAAPRPKGAGGAVADAMLTVRCGAGGGGVGGRGLGGESVLHARTCPRVSPLAAASAKRAPVAAALAAARPPNVLGPADSQDEAVQSEVDAEGKMRRKAAGVLVASLLAGPVDIPAV